MTTTPENIYKECGCNIFSDCDCNKKLPTIRYEDDPDITALEFFAGLAIVFMFALFIQKLFS
jgi:hypothetical protein